MKAGRFEHTSTLLPDGRVLVVGGQTTASMLDSTELLSADGASFSDGPKLPEPRSNHGAALLADGRVLIVGGGPNSSNGIPGGNGVLASALLFDPATNELTETAPLKTARSHFATARLADGRVLVAGGTAEGGDTAEGSEIYDPATGTWSEVSGPATATAASEATVLKDGKVLVVGGLKGSISKNVSLFDGTTWTKLPSTDLPRYRHSLAPLPSGGALVAAGLVGNGIFSSAVERLSGDLSAWSEAPDLTSGGDGIEKPGGTGTVALALPSGRVLVTGSYGPVGVGFGASRFASIYDETSDAWSEVAQPIDSRGSHSALRLQDGRVILIGGIGGSNGAIKTTERTKAPVE
jgi:hypothetical protein